MAVNIDEKIDNKLQPLSSRLKDMNFLLMAVVIVLFVGITTMFVAVWGMILDATRFKTETYQSLVSEIGNQKAQMQILSSEIQDLRDFAQKCNSLINIGC